MEQILPWIIRIVGGAVGGNAVGKMSKDLSLGTVGNSIAGILGGGIGGQLLSMFGIGATPNGGMDLGAIAANVGSAGAGGGVLMVVIGMAKKFLIGKKATA